MYRAPISSAPHLDKCNFVWRYIRHDWVSPTTVVPEPEVVGTAQPSFALACSRSDGTVQMQKTKQGNKALSKTGINDYSTGNTHATS